MPFTGATRPKIAAVIVACPEYEHANTWNSATTVYKEVDADFDAWTSRYGGTYAVRLSGSGSAAKIEAKVQELAAFLGTTDEEHRVLFVFLGVGGWVERGAASAEPVVCVPETIGEELDGAIPLSDLAAMFEKHLPYHAVTAVFDCGFKDDGSPRAVPGGPRAVVRPGLDMTQVAVRLRDIDRVIPSLTPVPAVEPGAYGQNGAITAALLETYFTEVEIDPGTATGRHVRITAPGTNTVTGKLEVVGAQTVQLGSTVWEANSEIWLWTVGPAWPDAFDLVLTNAPLQGFPGGEVHVNGTFPSDTTADAAEIGVPRWKITVDATHVGWLTNDGAHVTWYVSDAWINPGSRYLNVGVGVPIRFTRQPADAPTGTYRKLVT